MAEEATTGSMWDKVKELSDQYGGGTWLRLKKDGEKFTGMFLGEPFPREVFFDQAANRYVAFTAAHKTAKKKPTLRIAICVGTPDEKVQIFEMTVPTYKSLMAVRDKYGLKRFFEVVRVGKEGDTKTNYNILPEDPPTEDVVKKMHALELLDIAAEYERNAPEPDDDDAPQKEFKAGEKKTEEKKTDAKSDKKTEEKKAEEKKPQADDGLDAKIAQSIGAALKAFPPEKITDAVKEFLGKFGVKTIKGVPRAKQDEAIAFVEELAKKHGVGPQPSEEVDPFA